MLTATASLGFIPSVIIRSAVFSDTARLGRGKGRSYIAVQEMDDEEHKLWLEMVERMNALGMLVDVSHLSDGGFWDCIRVSRAPIIASHSNARALCGVPRNLTDDMLRALAEKGGAAGLNFYPVFLRETVSEVTVQDIARHPAHMIAAAGEDLPAIGTDFDGYVCRDVTGYISGPGEMEKVWEAMKKQGITERQLDKIWSGNALRVLKAVI